jgi:hypothetical protein
MLRKLSFLGLAALLPAAAMAQSTRHVPLGNSVYDVFQLTSASPTRSFTVDVNGASQLVIDVRTGSTPVGLELIAPDGSPVDPASFTQLVLADADVPPLGAVLFDAGAHVQAAVAAPLPGSWTARLSLPAGAPDAIGSFTALMTGGLALSAITSRSSYEQGDVAVLGLLAFDGAVPVAGATVTASIYQSGAEASPLVVALHDDGNDPDALAGDGLYSAPVDLAAFAPGEYLIEMVLQAGAVRATSAAEFEVMPRLAHFTGAVSDAGLDTNGDGLFDQIAVDLGVAAEAPGTYGVTVLLRKDAAHSLTAGTVVTLATGFTTVRVPFGADAIRASLAADGPYPIAQATLIRLPDAGMGERVADQRTDLGSTSAWLLSQLQRPVVIIPAGLTEAASDLDGNGQFDSLQVNFAIDTRQSDFFTWSGELRAPDGSVIGVASSQGFLPAGVSQVSFVFDGRRIGASNLDGPYTVANIAAYGFGDDAAVLDTLGNTRAYQATQFEGSRAQVTFARLIDEVNRLVITGRGGVPRANGIRTSLLKKAENAEAASLAGRTAAAIGLLDAFVNEVNAQSGQHLFAADAAALADLVQRLETRL